MGNEKRGKKETDCNCMSMHLVAIRVDVVEFFKLLLEIQVRSKNVSCGAFRHMRRAIIHLLVCLLA